jgi:hypothetical protein
MRPYLHNQPGTRNHARRQKSEIRLFNFHYIMRNEGLSIHVLILLNTYSAPHLMRDKIPASQAHHINGDFLAPRRINSQAHGQGIDPIRPSPTAAHKPLSQK